MRKRDTSRLILHYFIDFPYKLSKRNPIYVLKQNDFRPTEEFIEKAPNIDEKKRRIAQAKQVRFKQPISRKIFQNEIGDLLKEKFVIAVKGSDERSTYYAITPLGILHLIRTSPIYCDKINQDEQAKIFPILEYYANKFVNPYSSKIFIKENWDFKEFTETVLDNEITFDLRAEMPILFENIQYDSYMNTYSINVELLFERPTVFHLVTAEVFEDGVFINEMSRGKKIKLKDEQFNNYLAKLMLCMIVYFHFILYDDYTKKRNKIKHIDYSSLPDNLQVILQVFNFMITDYYKDNQESLNSFLQGLK